MEKTIQESSRAQNKRQDNHPTPSTRQPKTVQGWKRGPGRKMYFPSKSKSKLATWGATMAINHQEKTTERGTRALRLESSNKAYQNRRGNLDPASRTAHTKCIQRTRPPQALHHLCKLNQRSSQPARRQDPIGQHCSTQGTLQGAAPKATRSTSSLAPKPLNTYPALQAQAERAQCRNIASAGSEFQIY